MLKQTVIQPLCNLFGHDPESPRLDRRRFLKQATTLIVGGAIASPALVKAMTIRDRILTIYIPSTGETLRTVYWTPAEGYIHESLRQINWALRDTRADQAKDMDPKLLDELYVLQFAMDYNRPFHVISGYRTPATNAMLRRYNRAVAKDSFHMYGKAADIRMPGCSVRDLCRAALSLNAGGVGYYPGSGFVHVDTGPIRYWS